jgi:hypothetical protein
MKKPVICLVAKSGTGKTSLMEKSIAEKGRVRFDHPPKLE